MADSRGNALPARVDLATKNECGTHTATGSNPESGTDCTCQCRFAFDLDGFKLCVLLPSARNMRLVA